MSEKCVLCGSRFEPVRIPIEIPEIFGFKPPHKTICPTCFLKGVRDMLDFSRRIIDVYLDLEKKKRK